MCSSTLYRVYHEGVFIGGYFYSYEDASNFVIKNNYDRAQIFKRVGISFKNVYVEPV